VTLAKKVTKSWWRDSPSVCSHYNYNMKVGIWSWDLRFLQPCVWGFGSPGTWYCVIGLDLTEVSNKHDVFIVEWQDSHEACQFLMDLLPCGCEDVLFLCSSTKQSPSNAADPNPHTFCHLNWLLFSCSCIWPIQIHQCRHVASAWDYVWNPNGGWDEPGAWIRTLCRWGRSWVSLPHSLHT